MKRYDSSTLLKEPQQKITHQQLFWLYQWLEIKLIISAENHCKAQWKGTIWDLCQSINRKLTNLFLIWDRMTQYSTLHPTQTQHFWQSLNTGLHHEHIQQEMYTSL